MWGREAWAFFSNSPLHHGPQAVDGSPDSDFHSRSSQRPYLPTATCITFVPLNALRVVNLFGVTKYCGVTKLGEVLSCPQGACDPEVEKKGTVTKNSDVRQDKEMPKKVEGKETVKCGERL